MGPQGDDPPVAGRPSPVESTDASGGKRRRRRRRGKRSRWPYAAAREPSTRTDPADADGAGSAPARAASASSGPGKPIRAASPALATAAASPPIHPLGAGRTPPRALTPSAPPVPQKAAIPARAAAPGGDRAGQSGAIAADPARADRRPAPAIRRGRPVELYAALDLGTNNCRLLIAEPQRAGFRVVDAFSRIVRLGEGISSSRRLSEAAQDRAIEALKICRQKLDLRGVSRSRLVATEACRIAENGSAFLERVEIETGLALEVVSRETEARLAVAGCASLVDWEADGVVLFDIGGGSSELVWLDLERRGRTGDLTRHIRAWTSLPVGVVTLSEAHGGVVVDRPVFETMVAHVDGLLDALAEGDDLSAALAGGRFHMLGTSGTVTTLAGVHLGLRHYDRRRVDGTWLDDDDVSRMIDQLIAMSYEERVSNPCIGSDRADLVLAGCAILEAIRRRWPCDRLRVADRGLREGILTELMAADGVWRR